MTNCPCLFGSEGSSQDVGLFVLGKPDELVTGAYILLKFPAGFEKDYLIFEKISRIIFELQLFY